MPHIYAADTRSSQEIIQENCDRFYMEKGACCAGCDHWESMNSLIGECKMSAQVSGEDRMRALGFSYMSRPMAAGHVITKRDHACGLFEDTFDWTTLPLRYLKSIGYANRVPVVVEQSAIVERPMPWSDAHLVEFVGEFRQAMLGSAKSKLMCIAVSEPLQALLELHGQPCKLVEVKEPEYHHCFLTLPGDVVLDATADQFPEMPSVYLGAATELHKGARLMERANVWKALAREFARLNKSGCPKEYGRLVGLVLRTLPKDVIEFDENAN